MAKKFYAVKVGRQPGIFSTWAECQKQVLKYPGAVFKSFATKTEAEAYLNENPQTVAPIDEMLLPEAGKLIAYVDGSYDVVSHRFSYGAVLLDGEREETFQEVFSDPELADMRNVSGELKGAEFAIREALARGCKHLVIVHDYNGIAFWSNGAWQAKLPATKAYRDFTRKAAEQMALSFVKVKSHSGNKYNDQADKLAKDALGLS